MVLFKKVFINICNFFCIFVNFDINYKCSLLIVKRYFCFCFIRTHVNIKRKDPLIYYVWLQSPMVCEKLQWRIADIDFKAQWLHLSGGLSPIDASHQSPTVEHTNVRWFAICLRATLKSNALQAKLQCCVKQKVIDVMSGKR